MRWALRKTYRVLLTWDSDRHLLFSLNFLVLLLRKNLSLSMPSLVSSFSAYLSFISEISLHSRNVYTHKIHRFNFDLFWKRKVI